MRAAALDANLLTRLTRGGSPGNAAGLLALLAALALLFSNLLPGRFATFGTLWSASRNLGLLNCAGMPIDCDRSKWPTHRMSTPGVAAIASRLSMPVTDSICAITVVFRLAKSK